MSQKMVNQSEGRGSLELDVRSAESQINALIERRASQRDRVDELVEIWARSERAHRDRLRREYAAAWYAHEVHMQELHTQLAQEHAAKAAALLEEPGGGGGR
jgi:hypothetical protein